MKILKNKYYKEWKLIVFWIFYNTLVVLINLKIVYNMQWLKKAYKTDYNYISLIFYIIK